MSIRKAQQIRMAKRINAGRDAFDRFPPEIRRLAQQSIRLTNKRMNALRKIDAEKPKSKQQFPMNVNPVPFTNLEMDLTGRYVID